MAGRAIFTPYFMLQSLYVVQIKKFYIEIKRNEEKLREKIPGHYTNISQSISVRS